MKGKLIKCFIVCLFVIFFAGGNVNGFYSQESWESSAIKKLEELDIVRNVKSRWSQSDRITRRDAFTVAYIVSQNVRQYHYKPQYTSIEEYKEFEESMNLSRITLYYNRRFAFEDLKCGSDDYILMANLFITGLAAGKEEEGNLYAGMDDPLTYNEAFATILRMTMPYLEVESAILSQKQENVYYDFAKEMKLISSDTIYDKYYYEYAPMVELEQLNKPVRAYEYLYFVYRALYIPTRPLGDYAPEPLNYKINDFYPNVKLWGDDIII